MRHFLDVFVVVCFSVFFGLGCSRATDFGLRPMSEQALAREQILGAYRQGVLPFAKSKTVGLNGRQSVPQVFLEQSAFVWGRNNERLIVMVGSISDDVSPIPGCDSDPSNPFDDRCEWARWRSSTCYFFVSQMSGELIDAHPISLPLRAWGFRGRTRCAEVAAVADAKVGKGGVLLVLGFSDSMEDASNLVEINRKMEAFLFVPVQTARGWSFVQDRDCLAQQPPVSTVIAARNILKRCGK